MPLASLPTRSLRLAPAARRPGTGSPARRVAPAALSPDTGALAAAVGFLGVVNQYMAIQVVKARKQYNVPYPEMYATGASEDAYKFNSVQRAHMNGVENAPFMLATTLLFAVAKGARSGALLLFIWTVSRLAYFTGYSKNGPSGRMLGALSSSLTQLGATLALLFWGVKALVGA